MTLLEAMSLFGIMIVLAALPSASVALVVTRSATAGLAHGFAVSVGIVLGDLVFVLLAIAGLSVVAEAMGSVFVVIRYLGGCYLIWLGYSLCRASGDVLGSKNGKSNANLFNSFIAGFLLTLGDIKAILFYASLLPLFLDLSTLHSGEVFTVVFITIIAVGGVKAAYALLATKIAGAGKNRRYRHAIGKAGGAALIGAGSYVIIKT